MREITDIKELQKIGLDVLLHIDKICKEHNIKYFLAYGTTIGAVRHKGFIPWDDDIDILMPRDDYEKFIKIDFSSIDPNYKCLCFENKTKNYCHPYAKLVNTQTTVITPLHKDIEDYGIWVDIFPIDNMPKGHKFTYFVYRANVVLGRIASAKKFKHARNGSFFKSIFKFMLYLYAKLLGYKHFMRRICRLQKKFNKRQCDYIGAWGNEAVEVNIMPKHIYDEAIYVDFENCKLPIMKEYDYFLKRLYGDYMSPPPAEKQQPSHEYRAFWKE